MTVVTYWWGEKYGTDYVERLAAALKRGLKQPYRFVVISGNPGVSWTDIEVVPMPNKELTKHQGCFVRLRLFDPKFQEKIKVAERVVCCDLDVVITGDIDPLFLRPEPFVILQGANAVNPCPFNGSLWMLRAGYRPDVWSEFSLEAAAKVPLYEFPDDQGWFAHKIPSAAAWKAGSQSGVYAFQKPGWPQGNDLPSDARMVVFPGWRSPDKFQHLPWVRGNWR